MIAYQSPVFSMRWSENASAYSSMPVTEHVSLLDDDYLTPARAQLTAPPVLLTRTLKAFMRIAE